MYLTLSQLAESLGVTEKVITDWMHEAGLPHVADRNRLLFDRAEVAHWAATHGLAERAGFLADERARGTLPPLSHLLRVGGVWREVPSAQWPDVLEQVLGRLPGISAAERAWLGQQLRHPQGLNWAPVGHGHALPHFRQRLALGPDSGAVALLRLQAPGVLPVAPPDPQPVRVLWFFVPPHPRVHLELLGRLSRAVSRPELRAAVERADSDAEILRAVEAVETGGPPAAAAPPKP